MDSAFGRKRKRIATKRPSAAETAAGRRREIIGLVAAKCRYFAALDSDHASGTNAKGSLQHIRRSSIQSSSTGSDGRCLRALFLVESIAFVTARSDENTSPDGPAGIDAASF